jgi:hypothetical protein
MKKINLKGISEILTEKELKNVMGGSGDDCSCAGRPVVVRCIVDDSVLSEWETTRCPDTNECPIGQHQECVCTGK